MSEQSPPPPTPEGPLSPDGHYRWDGSKWQPAAGTAGVPSTKGGIATIWVVLSLIFCFPLGFIFIFFSRWTQKTKLIVAGVFGGLLLLGLISIAASPKTTTSPTASHSPSPFTSPSPRTSLSPTAELTPSPTPVAVIKAPPTIASTPPAATIPEDLTFGGSVQGHATAGLGPHPHADSDPRGGDHNAFTEWTQCADFSYDFNGGHTAHTWLAVVVVDLGGKRYALWLEVDKDQTQVSGSHQTGLQDNAEIPYLEQKNPHAEWTRDTGSGTFTVSPDQKSGDVNLHLAPGQFDPNIVTVNGHWACP